MIEGNNFLEVLTVLSECVSELILKTDLGGKVEKKVYWKEQKLLRGKERTKNWTNLTQMWNINSFKIF